MKTFQEWVFMMTILGTFNLLLGTFALTRDFKSRLNRSFAALQFSQMLWAFSIYSFYIPNLEWGYFFARVSVGFGWAFLFCYLIFLQVLLGIEDQPASQKARRIGGGFLLLTAPIFLTKLIFKGFKNSAGDMLNESEFAGPLYPFFWAAFVVWAIYGCVLIYRHWGESTAVVRNQLKYIIFMVILANLAVSIRILNFFDEMRWIFMSLLLASQACFAYAIFKHHLFEFSFWMRRTTIYLAVYLPLLWLPFVFLLSKDTFLEILVQSPILVPTSLLFYAVLFSSAPFLTNYLRDKTETKKWAEMNHQLGLILTTGQNLASEANLSLQEISRGFVQSIKSVYKDHLKNPLKHVSIVVKDFRGDLVYASYPKMTGISIPLKPFQVLPDPFIKNPFTGLDLRRQLQSMGSQDEAMYLIAVLHYFKEHKIEVAIPCQHNGQLYGMIFLGAKNHDIFSTEELKTLFVAAGHVATAVRKAELLQTNKKLKGIDKLKSEFISNITHEFKSPVHVIENAVQILIGELSKPNTKKDRIIKYIQMIRNNNSQLNVFIQNLLEVVKIEKSKVDIKYVRGDLNKVVQDAIELFVPMAENKGLKLSVMKGDPIRMEMDIPKINQVLCNLISNAIKNTEHGGVQVGINRKDEKALIWVKDTGQGMASSDLPLIFKKFFQATASRNFDVEGTGLGLAIAKGWVEAHHGRIWATSGGINQGMTFFVELPLPATPQRSNILIPRTASN